MTLEAERGLSFFNKAFMGGTMSTVAGNALHLCDRLVLNFIPLDFIRDIRVAGKTDFTRLPLDQISLIGSVGPVAFLALPFGEGVVSRRFRFLADQFLMTRKAEFAAFRRDRKQTRLLAAMGAVATGTFSSGERSVLAEQPLFNPDLIMAGETKGRFSLDQQFAVDRIVGRMTIETESFFGGEMRIVLRRIGCAVMTVETESRRIFIQQGTFA